MSELRVNGLSALRIPEPSEKQWQFFRDRHKYVAFGGARGGGKSWAVRVKAVLLCLRYPGMVVMIVRRTYPELLANHIRPMRGLLAAVTGGAASRAGEFSGRGFARYNDARKEMTFANGSMILFRYCAREGDMDRYQGTEADVIFLDEATQLEERVFRMFAACLRGVNSYPKRMYLTCNPGGRGHGWVKRLFVDRAYQADEDPEDYSFIRSLVHDNRALMEAQPEYVRHLEALPPKLRAAWLEGDWNVFEGQFFEEFVNAPYEEGGPEARLGTEVSRSETNAVPATRPMAVGRATGMGTHVIEPFPPPKTWKRYRSFDFGYAKPFSCGWWAVNHQGVLYRIAELYGCAGTPNEGVKWEPSRVFGEIRRMEKEHPYLAGLRVEGVADPSIWDSSRGVSVADMAARQGIYFEPGDNKRIPGWMQVHYRLRFDEYGYPLMYVFDTCAAFIRTIPLLTYDELVPEDVDTNGEDHVADEVRYMCMRNPVNPPAAPAPGARGYDPLGIGEEDSCQIY